MPLGRERGTGATLLSEILNLRRIEADLLLRHPTATDRGSVAAFGVILRGRNAVEFESLSDTTF